MVCHYVGPDRLRCQARKSVVSCDGEILGLIPSTRTGVQPPNRDRVGPGDDSRVLRSSFSTYSIISFVVREVSRQISS